MVDADRTTTEPTRSSADQRKTTQTPHPSARDGSGIPLTRVYKMACVIGSMRVCYEYCLCGGCIAQKVGLEVEKEVAEETAVVVVVVLY